MSTALSWQTRAENLQRIGAETFDVLVIGGGIVGAGIARDAARRGLTTALVERGDFAGGTSGKTSRLVHGGLRYLQRYRIGLVGQAVRERDLLVQNARALVHPIPFLIPAYRDRGPGPWLLRFGLFLYDLLSKDKTLPRREWLQPEDAQKREPRLGIGRLAGAGIYHDAWTDDARLVLAVIKDAARAGAAVANYAKVEALTHSGTRVSGAKVHDLMTGELHEARARTVVNATGVWLDRLRTPREVPTIRPTKGVHIVLPRAKVGNRQALALTMPRDGRVVFVLPWDDLTLVGTTDTDFRGDMDRVVPDANDVAYLLEAVNDAFPEARAVPEDVVSSYAGLRPLLRKGRADVSESEASREHAIFEDEDGLVSVAGGKLTTHRAMAEEAVNLIAARLGRKLPVRTHALPLGPPLRPLEEFAALGIDEATALHLQRRFAPDEIRTYLDAPSAREPIMDGLPHIQAEVEIALHEEMAMTLADVLVRRLGLFYEAADQGLAASGTLAKRIGRTLGWDVARTERETESYRELVAAHRRFKADPS